MNSEKTARKFTTSRSTRTSYLHLPQGPGCGQIGSNSPSPQCSADKRGDRVHRGQRAAGRVPRWLPKVDGNTANREHHGLACRGNRSVGGLIHGWMIEFEKIHESIGALPV